MSLTLALCERLLSCYYVQGPVLNAVLPVPEVLPAHGPGPLELPCEKWTL